MNYLNDSERWTRKVQELTAKFFTPLKLGIGGPSKVR